MQTYIYNPLLIDGKKFDFRIYMLIASSNPLILYFSDGYLRVSTQKYDTKSKELGVHLTNTYVAEKVLKKGKSTISEQEFKKQYWTMTKLGEYLHTNGLIKDTNWIETGLRTQIKRAMSHLARATAYSYEKRSNTYELFGIDFLLDENLKLWFIECNAGPQMKRTNPEKEKMLKKMLMDHFEIMFGYLRSRAKRTVQFVNRITTELGEKADPNNLVIFNLQNKQAEFAGLDMNYFEPEYRPSKANGFVKVIDGNLGGTAMYSNLIPEECL